MLTSRARIVLAVLTIVTLLMFAVAVWFLLTSSAGNNQPLIDLRELGATIALTIPLVVVVTLGMHYVLGVKPSVTPTPLTAGEFVRWMSLIIVLMVVINLAVFLLLMWGFGVDRTVAQIIGRAASFGFGFAPSFFLMFNRKRL